MKNHQLYTNNDEVKRVEESRIIISDAISGTTGRKVKVLEVSNNHREEVQRQIRKVNPKSLTPLLSSQFPLQTESAATSYLRVPSPNSSSSLHSLRRPRLPASNLRPPSSRPRHCPFQPAQTASSPHRPVRPVPFSLFPSFAALLVTSVSDIFSHFSLIPERIFRHMAKRWKKRRKKEGKVGMAMAMAVVVMVMEAVMVIVEEESGGRVWKWSR
ncbi:uncharacterized protein [Arachis hypogaea]|uniref:uncharacterized protein n=1 Tax=Arachis hypogaea TaxID=3818 RepID=UPI000DEC4EA9|nr:uncharacterized protein LOC112722113 [Arachis hypogaea]